MAGETLWMSLPDSELLQAESAEDGTLTLRFAAASAERGPHAFGHVAQAWLALQQASWQLEAPAGDPPPTLAGLIGRIGPAQLQQAGRRLLRWPLPGTLTGPLTLSLTLPYGVQLHVQAAEMSCGHAQPLRWQPSLAC